MEIPGKCNSGNWWPDNRGNVIIMFVIEFEGGLGEYINFEYLYELLSWESMEKRCKKSHLQVYKN
jgi:hypothetical protein